MSSSEFESDILVVGAGAKAAALAAKVHTINTLGLAEISMTVIEKTEPAASWLGRNGMTSGEEPLAIPPVKDVGFPYQSSRQFGSLGDAIDGELLPLTWQRFAMERHEYATWVNSGSPSVMHRDYGGGPGGGLAQTPGGGCLFDGGGPQSAPAHRHPPPAGGGAQRAPPPGPRG